MPARLDVSEDQGRVPCVTSVSVGAKPVDIRPSAYVGFPEGIKINVIFIHSKYFPNSDWLKAHP